MLNEIVIMGRFTADPELKATPSGISVVSFTLAVDRDFLGKDKEKVTDFIQCVAWRNNADYIGKWFTKGSKAVVSGSLQSRQWEKDGTKRTAWEVLVENIYNAGERKTAPAEATATAPAEMTEIHEEDGDLPF